MRTVLHISDVHFGPPHLPRLASGVLALVEERHPNLLVISGDLTQRALPGEFQQARAFVDRIHQAGVATLVVPGNHDVPFHKPPHRLWQRFLDPYGEYRRHFSRELEPVYRDEEMVVVGVNTAFGWTIKDGRITLRRLLEVAALLEAVPEAVCKVVVAHHHMIPPPSFGTQRVLRNAGEAVDVLAAAGVELILSGHQHMAYIGNSEEFYPRGGRAMVILHSGTTTSSRGRGGERDQNTCNWIEIAPSSLTISLLRWAPELDRFAELSRHWYQRRPILSQPHDAAVPRHAAASPSAPSCPVVNAPGAP